jgi:environmental stress-induced protein Ves
MAIVRLPREHHAEMPWANGLGVTREIAADRAPGASRAPFLWRASMADLAGDGPFSILPDVDRVLVLLEGADVALAIDGASPAPLAAREAIAFAGDVPVHLTMGPGPGADLNLMWDRTRAEGDAAVLAAGATVGLAGLEAAVAVALDDAVVVDADGASHALRPLDALLVRGTDGLSVDDGAVWVGRVRLRSR